MNESDEGLITVSKLTPAELTNWGH